MKTITKEELVLRWLVAFGYKAKVKYAMNVIGAFYTGGDGVQVKIPNTENPKLLLLVLSTDVNGWYIPDEWFDEVLGVRDENNH